MFSSLSRPLINISRKSISLVRMASNTTFETLAVSVPKEFVYHVKLNRPDKLNSLSHTMWLELGKCFEELSEDEDCRVVVLSAEGKMFCAGIDLNDFMKLGSKLAEQDDVARRAKIVHKSLVAYQRSITSLELCRKPVLAAIHSACVGAGANLITAADIRYCTKDAWFQVKEVDVGLAADVGALQRLPKIIGSDGLARELCYTVRKMHADEALSSGLVTRVYENKDKMIEEVEKIAEVIAKKSPVAVQGTKVSMVYSRDHSVQEGLDQIAFWNQLMLQSQDLTDAATGMITKEDVKFSKL